MPITVSPTVPTESSPAVPAGGFSQWFRNIGDWLKSVSPAGASEYDTGWVNVTIAPGFKLWGAQPSVRRIGRTVYFVGGIQPESGNFSTASAVTIGSVPSGFITTYWQHTQSMLSVGGNSGWSCSAQVAADGSIIIRLQSGMTVNTVALKGLSGYVID